MSNDAAEFPPLGTFTRSDASALALLHDMVEALMYWGHYWGMHMLWWIFWLLMIGAFVLWAWRSNGERRHDDAVEALRRQYAEGNISEEDFRQRLRVLAETEYPPRQPRSKDAAAREERRVHASRA